MASGNQTKSIISISFLVTICLIVFIALNANRFMQSMSENNSRLYDAYRISELMKSFRSNVTVMGNKERSYIVTGDPKFREEYKLKESETKAYLQLMEKYFLQKPEEALFKRLKTLTYQKMMQAKNLSHTMPGIPLMPEEAEQDQSAGIRTLDEINSTIDLINQSLATSTKGLLDNSVSYVQSSRQWGLLEVAAGILATLIAVAILFKDVNIRNRLEEELRVAKKQADDNARMKEQFMANMSHEIRTPMNAILGFSELLHKTPLNAAQAEYLSAIRHSGNNLLHLINDILDVSKIEAGMLLLEEIPFSIRETINSLRLIFEEKAREKGLRFSMTQDPRIPARVCGDPTRLNQILLNLLSNAVKFTQEGVVSLRVDVDSIEAQQVKLRFVISDTGIGIPAEKQTRIFDRFNQGNPETTRKYGGTGLGLSIVKSLLEIQKGAISFTSEEGKGSEFCVEITYALEKANELPSDTRKEASALRFAKPWRVLLAEDNVLNQKLTTTLLQGFGLATDLAVNGEEALEKLKQRSYDLVLMDIQMPVLDGYQATQRIREELKLNLPVVAMTANSMDGESERCRLYGMNGYISKPFREEELYTTISRFLDPRHEPLPSAITSSVTEPDLSHLYGMANGNQEFIREMVQIFVERNPEDVAELRQASASGNFRDAAAVAHRMKTSVGFLGMPELMEIVSELEELAKQQQDLDALRKLATGVGEASEQAVTALQAMLITLNRDRKTA